MWALIPTHGAPSAAAGLESRPLAPPSVSESSTTLFEILPASRTGIDVRHEFPPQAPFVLLQDQGAGAGLCAGDYDGDGWPDLFLANYNQGNRLYRNLGNWRFEDATSKAGVAGAGRWCGGAVFADVDNDGDLDLYVAVFNAPSLLFLNQGDGTFAERARAARLDYSGASVMMAFADYDLDGQLDGYLVTHRLAVGPNSRLPRSSREAFDRGILQSSSPGKLMVLPPYRELFALLDKAPDRMELAIAGQRDRLFHNAGGGVFADVTEGAGIQGNDIGLAAVWWDYNDDGLPDLYVSNDYRGPDRLYRNQGGGRFTEVTTLALPHVPWSSMGSDTADINNDGRIDCLATEMAGSSRVRRAMISGDMEKDRWFLETSNPRQYQRNALYLGTGTWRVFEVASLAGLESTDWTWSPKFADLDNDGWVDLFIANGMSRDFINADLLPRMKQRDSLGWRNTPMLREENMAFQNLGNLTFRRVGREWGLDQVSASFCATLADFDRDGDLDLIVMQLGEPLLCYRNNGSSGARVLIRLQGHASHSWGTGATVRLSGPWGVQTRPVTLTSGFMSANEPLIHFGLGTVTNIPLLTVHWPSGIRQSFTNLAAGHFYTVREPAQSPAAEIPRPPQSPWFRQGTPLNAARHQEKEYNDFLREPLLPWKLSRLGPGLAVGDVDGDEDEDLFLGGAAGQSGGLWLRDGKRFLLHQQSCFDSDQQSEDLGAVFFDLEGDGDLDLYVVSGGVECEPNDPVLGDRVYLNDGQGRFTKAPASVLPTDRDSGSVAAAGDFDRDGDLDLFIGGRSVPGRYLTTPNSRLWRNSGGRLEDATDTVAPQLRQSGLVTSALWSDVDDDGWLDLLVTQDWGPVRLYSNRAGQLVENSREAGLHGRSGWWNGIAGRDLDGDGDIDYVVTNLGLNTRYRASPSQPVAAFYGDFDGRGANHLIEAEVEDGQLYPLRARSTLCAVTPFLGEKFPTSQSFATATLSDLYGSERLQAALRVEVNCVESGVLRNDGRGRFSFLPLPRLAQIAPAFGVVIEDFDADGRPDLFLAHNFAGPQPETGRLAGGGSLLLRGRGDGTFDPIWPDASGILVPGDAKCAAALDFNDDDAPDILIGVNDGEWVALQNAGTAPNRRLLVRLRGRGANSTAAGARVSLTRNDGVRQCTEVYAGGAYLAQGSPRIHFARGVSDTEDQLEVRWPDGRSQTVSVSPGERSVLVTEQ